MKPGNNPETMLQESILKHCFQLRVDNIAVIRVMILVVIRFLFLNLIVVDEEYN